MQKLRKEFKGIGEVSGSDFKQLKSSANGYIYQVSQSDVISHYEVVKKHIVHKYDFVNKVQLEETTESYPKSSQFGIRGWTYKKLCGAITKLDQI